MGMGLLLNLGCQPLAENVPDPRLFQNNKQGVEALQTQNFLSAKDSFIRALEYAPFSAEVLINLGLSFQLSQDPEKALSTYQKAEEIATQPALKFLARYNRGQLLHFSGKVDEALVDYQRALELKPDSIEVKTNIEMMIQRQQQQQKGDGDGDSNNQDQKNDKNDKKDSKDGQDKDQKDKDDKKDDKDGQKKEQPKDKQMKESKKYKPREFKGELSQSDVNKILGELKNQEQKIRGNYYKNESKDQPRDKDW